MKTNLRFFAFWALFLSITPFLSFAQVPTINVVSPYAGRVGDTITIQGTNFFPHVDSNSVFFGKKRANIVSATATTLRVLVPIGAPNDYIYVRSNRRVAVSSLHFRYLFNGGSIKPNNFGTPTTAFLQPANTSNNRFTYADMDNDGNLDIVVPVYGSNQICISRNTSPNGGAISFAPPTNFTSANTPYTAITADFDNDGREDILVGSDGGNSNTLVFRNTSTGAGNIALSVPIPLVYQGNMYALGAADIDSDGLLDIIIGSTTASSIRVFRNTSTGIGNISFASVYDVILGITPNDLALADFDSDGKVDIAVVPANGSSFRVLKNTSSGAGLINFNAPLSFITLQNFGNPSTIRLRDMNNDGKIEIVVSSNNVFMIFQNISTGGSILFNTVVGYTPTTNSFPYGFDVEDLNGDGFFDLGSHGGTVFSVSENAKSTGPITVSSFLTPVAINNALSFTQRYIQFMDLNNDGFKDAISYRGASNVFTVRPYVFICSSPEIVSQPQPRAACIGNRVVFRVGATGNGNITYQWRKNGVVLIGANRDSLVIDSVVSSDAGNFSVVISDSCVLFASASATVSGNAALIISNGPVLANDPINSSVCGGELLLTPSVISNGSAPSFQWRLNGANIPGATNQIYRKAITSALDVGIYSLQMTNSCGTIIDTVANVSSFTSVPAPTAINQAICFPNTSLNHFNSTTPPLSHSTFWYDDLGLTALLQNGISFNRSYNQADTIYARNQFTSRLDGVFSLSSTLAGDDRSALAVTRDHYFYTGDNGVIRFDMPNLTNPRSYPILRDGMFSVTAGNGRLLSFGNLVDAWQTTSTQISHIWRLDTNLSVISGSSVPLIGFGAITISSSINYVATNDSFVVFVSGSLFYKINVFTGFSSVISVSNTNFSPSLGENNYGFGILEIINGNHYITYKSNIFNTNGVSRYHVEGTSNSMVFNPTTTNVFSDMSTLLFAPWYNRYYFKFETGTASTLSLGFDEVFGYANAPFAFSNEVCPSPVSTILISSNILNINTQPTAQNVCAGTNATFTVNASAGSLPITYQWRRNGLNISGANSANYTMNNVNAIDSGALYNVNISTSCMNLLSNAAPLIVRGPRIITQPLTSFNCPGEPVSLSVGATGSGNLSYQWQRNGVNITGATQANYNILSLSPLDTGLYRVSITDTCNVPVFSNAVRVFISNGPQITSTIGGSLVCLGQSATLSVSASGNGVLTYQWRKNGQNITGAIGNSLTISNFTASDTGSYQVILNDNCGQTNSASIILQQLITPRPNIANATFCTSSNIFLQDVSAPTPGYLTRWYDDRNLTALLGSGASINVFRTGSDTIFARKESVSNLLSGVVTRERGSAGDDRGGIAVTQDYYYNVGDNSTMRYRMPDLTIPTLLPIRDGIFSTTNGSGVLYSFGSSTAVMGPFNTGSLTHIWRLDSTLNALPLAPVALSTNISTINFIASGPDYILVKSATNIFKINPVTGLVTSLSSSVSGLSQYGSENWASWGYSQFIGGQHHIVYRSSIFNNSGLNRYIVETGINQIEFNAGAFNPISDMASLTYAPWTNRVYFHFEGGTAETNSLGFSETSGYCDAPMRFFGGCPSMVDTVLIVQNSLTITAQPQSLVRCVGSPILLKVGVTGINHTFQWRKNGVNISGATADSLFIASASLADDAVYSVAISNACGSLFSNNATVVVRGILINTQPTNVRNCLGEQGFFSIIATGRGTLSYQWRKNGINIVSATNAIYFIPAIATTDTGTYTVLITDSCGTPISSQEATLTISNGPLLTSVSQSASICANTSATLNVLASGNGTVNFQWRKNGNNILGATFSSFVISNFTPADTGVYTVAVSDLCGLVISNPINLCSFEPVMPTVSNSSVCAPGTSVTLTNTTAAPLGYTTRWYDNGAATILLGTGSSLVRVINTTDTFFVRNEINVGICNSRVDTVIVTINATNSWIGATNTNWFNASNWSCGQVPNATTNAFIPGFVTLMPVINIGLSANVNVLSIAPGATVNMLGASTLNVFGQLINSGTLNCPGGLVNFANTFTTIQIPTGNYFNISVQGNPNGASLSGDIRVRNNFSFVGNCIVRLNNFNLIKDNHTVSTLPGAGVNAYFATNGNGSLVLPAIGNGATLGNSAFAFVGNSTYNPISFTNTGAIDTFQIRVLDSVAPAYVNGIPVFNAFTNHVVNRSWFVKESTPGSLSLTVVPGWNVANEGTGFDRTLCYVSQYNAGWTPTTVTGSAVLANSVFSRSSGITATSFIFGVASNNALPVNWLSLNGKKKDLDVNLHWQTASEENNDYFEIERSADGNKFVKVGSLRGAGNSIVIQNYNFTDELAFSNEMALWYYRIKQVDKNAAFSYSKVISINNESSLESKLQVYPNPFTQEVNIVISDNPTEQLLVELLDMHGKLIAQYNTRLNLGNSYVSLDPTLASGIYFMKVYRSDGQIENIKLQKQ